MPLVPWFSGISPLWFHVAIAGTWVVAIGLLAEWLHRHTAVESELSRKVVHIGTGNVILFAWWFNIPAWVGVGASVVFGALTFVSYQLPILPSINGVGRKSLGTFFYAVSIGVLVGYFWHVQQPHYAALGVLVMTWGDGLAALVGQRFGKHPYKLWDMPKSWEGSLTMALISYLVSCLILLSVQGTVWQTWVVSLVVALVATSLESFSKFGIDNLTVPLGSAAIAYLLGQWLPLG